MTGKWLWKIEVGIVNIPVRYDDNLDCRDGNGKFFFMVLWYEDEIMGTGGMGGKFMGMG